MPCLLSFVTQPKDTGHITILHHIRHAAEDHGETVQLSLRAVDLDITAFCPVDVGLDSGLRLVAVYCRNTDLRSRLSHIVFNDRISARESLFLDLAINSGCRKRIILKPLIDVLLVVVKFARPFRSPLGCRRNLRMYVLTNRHPTTTCRSGDLAYYFGSEEGHEYPTFRLGMKWTLARFSCSFEPIKH
jgi:hypothetical protein